MVAFHGTMADLFRATLLEKTDSLSPGSYELPILVTSRWQEDTLHPTLLFMLGFGLAWFTETLGTMHQLLIEGASPPSN